MGGNNRNQTKNTPIRYVSSIFIFLALLLLEKGQRFPTPSPNVKQLDREGGLGPPDTRKYTQPLSNGFPV